MVRVQIQFTEGQAEALRRQSAAERRSVAAIVREAVDRALRQRGEPSREERVRRAREVIGAFDFGVPDLAERHDEYLADAFDP